MVSVPSPSIQSTSVLGVWVRGMKGQLSQVGGLAIWSSKHNSDIGVGDWKMDEVGK